jgi:predicted Zn-dependent protease
MSTKVRRLGPSTATALAFAAATALVGGIATAQMVPKADPATVPAAPVLPQNSYVNLPDMGSGANVMISRADEFQVGRIMMKNLRDENLVLEDPETTEYMQALGSRIGAQAQDGTQRFTFFVVKERAINAFAIPGGFIGTNYGLILQTVNESELAGVLAHEIGHVVQRHIARAIQAQSRMSLPMMAAMLGAILIGAAGGGDGAIGLMAMAQGAAMQSQINFTRMEESEADRVGMGFLVAADFDPSGMANFFSTMGRIEGPQLEYYSVPDLLKSHPVTTLRIAEARARAAQLPAVRHIDPPSYALIRERLRVVTAAPEEDLRPYYAKVRANGADSLATQYGEALATLKAGDAASAVQTLRRLVDANPGVTILHSALGEAQMAAGDQDGALKTFAHAIQLYPRNVPVTVRYAETLLKAGRASQSHQLLLDLFNNETPTPEQIRLTALAASSAGDTGDAYYYMAEFHLASGDLMLATQQLDLALAEPRLTEVQRKRFLARRDEIRGYLREQRGQRAQPSGGGGGGGGR